MLLAALCGCTSGNINNDIRKANNNFRYLDTVNTAEIRLYERLFKVPNPGSADDFLSTINENSLRIIENAWIEPALQEAAVSEAFQFERTGYFCADSKYTTPEKKVFNLTVALKEDSQKAAA